MKEHPLVLTPEEREALGAIRCLPGLYVAEDELLYVKGIDEAAMADNRIKQLPVLHSYVLDEEQRLFPLHALTPTGRLKQLQWHPIADFINIELPLSAMPAKLASKLPVKLVQTGNANEGCALMTKLNTWKEYAETAPAVRLEHLRFAVASTGEVFIIGSPLPPIPGNEYYEDNEILLPAGYAFEVPLVSVILRQKFNTVGDAAIVFTATGDHYNIPSTSFVKASRSAIRLTTLNELK